MRLVTAEEKLARKTAPKPPRPPPFRTLHNSGALYYAERQPLAADAKDGAFVTGTAFGRAPERSATSRPRSGNPEERGAVARAIAQQPRGLSSSDAALLTRPYSARRERAKEDTSMLDRSQSVQRYADDVGALMGGIVASRLTVRATSVPR